MKPNKRHIKQMLGNYRLVSAFDDCKSFKPGQFPGF